MDPRIVNSFPSDVPSVILSGRYAIPRHADLPFLSTREGANVCVIAGYVGSRRAAPVLLEMIERQEGLAGGYYAGLLADLREKTSAAILTG